MTSVESTRDIMPWLVNGTLDTAERTVAQAAVDAAPDLQRERDFFAALRHSVQQQQLAEAPLELGWYRLQRDIRRERRHSVASGWRVATAAAVLVLLVQSLVVWLPHDDGRYRPLTSSVATATLQVRFVGSATQTDIQQLLRQQQLQIVDGPSAADLYRLKSKGDPAAALVALRRQPDLVDYVQLD